MGVTSRCENHAHVFYGTWASDAEKAWRTFFNTPLVCASLFTGRDLPEAWDIMARLYSTEMR